MLSLNIQKLPIWVPEKKASKHVNGIQKNYWTLVKCLQTNVHTVLNFLHFLENTDIDSSSAQGANSPRHRDPVF